MLHQNKEGMSDRRTSPSELNLGFSVSQLQLVNMYLLCSLIYKFLVSQQTSKDKVTSKKKDYKNWDEWETKYFIWITYLVGIIFHVCYINSENLTG